MFIAVSDIEGKINASTTAQDCTVLSIFEIIPGKNGWTGLYYKGRDTTSGPQCKIYVI